MGRKYENPPIVEALCEFQFEPVPTWDLAMPGLIYDKVRDSFPKRRQVRGLEVALSTTPKGVEQQVTTTGRVQFLREDEKAFVQVGPNLLAVNHLKPYPTWDNFLPLIQKGFEVYCEVVGPEAIHRIGLRYINRIEIPGERVELEDYFQFRPFVGGKLPQDFGPFIVGIQLPYEDSRDVLRIQLTSARVDTPDTVAIMLDLDYFLDQPGQVPLDKVIDWVKVAHDRLEVVFEGCITDRLRQIFEEEKA